MTYKKYTSKSPFFLSIMVNEISGRATVEFTSKILGERCVELITEANIQDCLERINESGVCQVESAKVIANAIVSKLDVTMDLELSMTDALKTVLQMGIKDSRKWESHIRKNDGIDIKKNVKSDSRRKERISFYDKGKEIMSSKNTTFLNSIANRKDVQKYFTNRTRVEYNLTSGTMVKEVLGVENLELNTILHCNINPIKKVCDKIFDRSLLENIQQGKLSYMRFESIQEFYRNLLLEKCGDDQSEVDRVLKHFYSPKTNLREIRKQFKRAKNKRLGVSQEFVNHVALFEDVINKISKH